MPCSLVRQQVEKVQKLELSRRGCGDFCGGLCCGVGRHSSGFVRVCPRFCGLGRPLSLGAKA